MSSSKLWAINEEDSSSLDLEDEERSMNGGGFDANSNTSGGDVDTDENDDDDPYIAQDPNRAWKKLQKAGSHLFLPVPKARGRKWGDVTRLVIISDTHGQHRQLHLPPGDILIHGGDFTKTGEVGTIEDLSSYFGELKERYESIICIAGNHDMSLDTEYYLDERNWYSGPLPPPFPNPRRFQQREQDATTAQSAIRKNCQYLEDTSCTTKDGLVVYGSPWTPTFFDWGFNAKRGDDINEVWDKIPVETDVLITHGPPLGRGDLTQMNGRAGCYDLLMQIQNRVKPRVSIFGHIHEGRGTTFDGTTLYVNASNCDIDYDVYENFPIVVDLPHGDKSLAARVVQPHCRVYAENLADWCRDADLHELVDALEKCDPAKLPSGNELLGMGGIDKIMKALGDEKVEGLAGFQECLVREVRPKLYADSFS